MSQHPSPINSLKLRVTQGSNTYEQVIPSSSPETTNSFPITNQTFPELLNAFNSQPLGTIFNPSIVATYAPGTFATGDVLSTPSTPANFVPRQITPTFSVANIPDKTTADEPFSVADLVTKTGTGVVSYSSSAPNVATINSSNGLVTIAGAGVTDITFSLAASADGVYKAAAPITKTLTVTSSGWTQRGQDIDGQEAGDFSGGFSPESVSLSADGTTVAVGASRASRNSSNRGHVRVWAWNNITSLWVQRGEDIDGEVDNEEIGNAVSLSEDGTIVAIGAQANPVNGSYSGRVRVWLWNGTAWVQRGQNIDGEGVDDYSGYSVSLSADGTIVAIGAPYNDGNGSNSGRVRVWEWDSSSLLWVQRGQNIDGEAPDDHSGNSVSLSADGTILAIGTRFNSNSNGSNSGSVRVWEWNSTTSLWVQRGEDIDGEAAVDNSGTSVSLSANGTIVAIGAPFNDGNGSNSGSVRVFEYQ